MRTIFTLFFFILLTMPKAAMTEERIFFEFQEGTVTAAIPVWEHPIPEGVPPRCIREVVRTNDYLCEIANEIRSVSHGIPVTMLIERTLRGITFDTETGFSLGPRSTAQYEHQSFILAAVVYGSAVLLFLLGAVRRPPPLPRDFQRELFTAVPLMLLVAFISGSVLGWMSSPTSLFWAVLMYVAILLLLVVGAISSILGAIYIQIVDEKKPSGIEMLLMLLSIFSFGAVNVLVAAVAKTNGFAGNTVGFVLATAAVVGIGVLLNWGISRATRHKTG